MGAPPVVDTADRCPECVGRWSGSPTRAARILAPARSAHSLSRPQPASATCVPFTTWSCCYASVPACPAVLPRPAARDRARPRRSARPSVRTPAFNTNTLPRNDDGSTAPRQPRIHRQLLRRHGYADLRQQQRQHHLRQTRSSRSPRSPCCRLPGRSSRRTSWTSTRVARCRTETKFGTDVVNGRACVRRELARRRLLPTARDDKLNIFQLVLLDRSDTGVGNFDFEFNYSAPPYRVGPCERRRRAQRRHLPVQRDFLCAVARRLVQRR